MGQFYRICKGKLVWLRVLALLVFGMLQTEHATAQAPGFAWAKQGLGEMPGSNLETGTAVGTDALGNIYMAGYLDGTTTFGTTILSTVPNSEGDIFLVKYSPAGEVIWARRAGGFNSSAASDIAVDAAGNCYITGSFEGNCVFGSIILSTLATVPDAFVAKYTTNGDVLWASKLGGNVADGAASIAIDSQGNSYITGSFNSTTIVFGNSTLTENGNEEILVAKFDATGNPVWARQAGGSDMANLPSDQGQEIAVDQLGNVYVAGIFTTTATFGSNTLVSNGQTDIFVSKYDNNGNLLYVKQEGGPFRDVVGGLALTPDGEYLLAGKFEDTITIGSTTLIGSGWDDIFIARYDAAADLLWVKKAGGAGVDLCNDLALDAAGNFYLTGEFQSTASFGGIILNSVGYRDYFVAKYDSGGNGLWAKRAGSVSGGTTPPFTSTIGNALALDLNGNVFTTGFFLETVSFGNQQFTANGLSDVFLNKYTNAGTLVWVEVPNGIVPDEVGNSVDVDDLGNSYVTGFFAGATTIGSTVLTSSGYNDIFLAKYDASGNVVWAKKAGGTLYDEALDLKVDAAGNSYITGSFSGTISFGATTLTSQAGSLFVAKYDPAGNPLWAKTAGSTSQGYSQGLGLALDGNGFIFLTGVFLETLNFSPVVSVVSNGLHDIFVAKYDTNGNFIWARSGGGQSGFDRGNAIAADANGNCYVTGSFEYPATFGTITLTSQGNIDIFIAKYNAGGDLLWVTDAGGPEDDFGQGIAVDNAGNSYLTGAYSTSASFGPVTLSGGSLNNIFVAKYTSAGSALWAQQVVSPGAASTGNFGFDITVDATGNSFVTGNFSETAIFGGTTLTSAGPTDIFVAKYSPTGTALWAKQAGGISFDAGFAIALDNSGNSFVTGRFSRLAMFGSAQLFAPNDGTEFFLAKIHAENNIIIGNVAPLAVCQGGTLTVTYTAVGIYNPGNVFTAQLSDAAGSFANPITIGTVTGTSSGAMVITLPVTISPNSGYRIRVVASDLSTFSNISSTDLTILPLPTVTVSSSPVSVCLGAAVTLSATGADIYQWAAGNGLAAQAGASVTATPTAAGTFTYSVTGTLNGCTAESILPVTVSPLPVAIAGPPRSICSNEATTIGAPAVAGHTYSWSPVTGLSDPFTANPSLQLAHTNPADQNLVYTLTVTNGGGCQSSAQVTVTLKALPVVNAGAPTALCGGTTGQLQPQSQQPGYSYIWSPANGLSNANTFAPAITLANNSNLPLSQTYTLTASLSGCNNSSTVQVTVNPRPTGMLTGSLSVCPSVQEVSYWFSGNSGTNAVSWGVSGGTVVQQFGTDSITVNWGLSNPNAYVWAIPKNQYNCLGDTIKLPVSINVLLITPTPTGPLSPCSDPDVIQNYSTFHTNNSTYNWGILGGQIVGGNGSSQVQVQWQQPGQGQLWVLQQSITATDTCYGISDTLLVQLLPIPNGSLAIQGSSSICAGTSTNYSLSGNASSSYQWQANGGQIVSGQGTGTISIIWPTAGNFNLWVVETNSNGCVGRQIEQLVQVNPVPATTISSSPPGVCPGNAANLSYAVQGLSGSTYNWQIAGGQMLSGQGSQQVSIDWNTQAAAHSLTVTETSNFGCSGQELAFPILVDNTQLQLVRVTVDTTNENQVLVYYQVQDSLNYPQQQVAVERKENAGNFSVAGNTPTSATVFTDAGLQTGEQAFWYRLQGQNLCADDLLSTEHATVWLQGQANEQNGLVQLNWSPYIGFGNQEIQYQVWRKMDNHETYQLLPGLTTTGTQLAAELGADGFAQCFRILAVATDTRQSWSNSICFNFSNPITAPNIITPNGDGKNDFLIIDKLHLYPNSELTVMNRWGKEVYRSQNYQNNWTADGLPTGLYFYQLQAPNKPLIKGWLEIVR